MLNSDYSPDELGVTGEENRAHLYVPSYVKFNQDNPRDGKCYEQITWILFSFCQKYITIQKFLVHALQRFMMLKTNPRQVQVTYFLYVRP